MATEAKDLFGHVQRNVFLIPSANVLHVSPEEDRWHCETIQGKADVIFGTYENAQLSGKKGKADRALGHWLHHVQLDRIAFLKEIARERGLRFDACGRGPVVDRPAVHYRDRLPWYLTPVGRYADRRLPDRACGVVETWNGAGTTFDGLFIADEPVSSGHFPVHDLICAVSADGRTGDWFVLDRWAS